MQEDQRPLSTDEWEEIALGIQQGDCVLVLGPDIAVGPNDVQHTPLTTVLSRFLAKKLKDRDPNCRIVHEDDLSHVAQLCSDHASFGRNSLTIAVENFYRDYDGQTTELHRELAELPFQLIINTTPDLFMKNAFAQSTENKTPNIDHYDLRQNPNKDFALNSDSPLIYNLYGSRKARDSLILTESDLLDFLISVIREQPALPRHIGTLLTRPSTTFLFVGFGFQKWHVRILLRSLQAQMPKSRSFALESPDFFKHYDLRRTVVFFENQRRIGFRLFSSEQFISELRIHHEMLVKRQQAPEPELPDTAPLVFLSYFHEDKEAVASLERELKQGGIQTWRDNKGIRGGDDWKRTISGILGACDYVAVIQSSHGDKRVESYVFDEIREALSRQGRINPNFRFVIPTKLDDCKNYPAFEEINLQFINLSQSDGAAQLVATIAEDWALRPAKARSQL